MPFPHPFFSGAHFSVKSWSEALFHGYTYVHSNLFQPFLAFSGFIFAASKEASEQGNKEASKQGGKKGRKEKRKQARSKVVAVLVVEVEVRHRSSNQLGRNSKMMQNVKVHVTR